MIIEPDEDVNESLVPDLIVDICMGLGMNIDSLEGHRVYPQGRCTRLDI